MGNGQSTPPSQKAVNKLSKPRTNSWGTLTSPKFGARSWWSSQPNILQYSLGSGEAAAGEDLGEDGTEGRLFRSKSSQGDASQVDVNSNVDGDHFDSSDRLSVKNPQTAEVEENTPNSPTRCGISPKR